VTVKGLSTVKYSCQLTEQSIAAIFLKLFPVENCQHFLIFIYSEKVHNKNDGKFLKVNRKNVT